MAKRPTLKSDRMPSAKSGVDYDPDLMPKYVDQIHNLNECRDCGAKVLWVTTSTGKRMTLAVEQEDPIDDDYGTYIPHWRICPRNPENELDKIKSGRGEGSVGGPSKELPPSDAMDPDDPFSMEE